jgi:hypothetical protein
LHHKTRRKSLKSSCLRSRLVQDVRLDDVLLF